MEEKKIIGWFSCGVTSAIACKLAIEKYGKDKVELFYIEIDSAHPDNERFIEDCEKWLGVKVQRRRCAKYKDQYEVVEIAKFVNSPTGAMCTKVLKKDVRKAIEKEVNFEAQIFGFEYSKKEVNRGIRFAQQYSESKPIYPLIDGKLTKEQCADILLRNGIRLPKMYELGFHNNNCIGCVKGGKGYWNQIRKHFPEHFERMAKAERIAGHSCIKHRFLDELTEKEGRHEAPILPDCGTFCEIEFAHIIDSNTEKIMSGQTSFQQLNLW